MIQVGNGKETLLNQCEENCKCRDPCRSHGVNWAAGGSFPAPLSRRSGLTSGTGLSMSNQHPCVLAALLEGALFRGNLVLPGTCVVSLLSKLLIRLPTARWRARLLIFVNPEQAAALPRANLPNPGVTTVKEPELLGNSCENYMGS